MHNSIQNIIELYREKRKEHIKATWQKPTNIFKRWLNPGHKVYNDLWSSDMALAHAEVTNLLNSLKALSPSKEEISEYILKLKTSNTTISDRNSYITVQAAIFIAIIAILSKSEFPTTFIMVVVSFLGIGFLLEQSRLKSEELINIEVKEIMEYYRASLA